MKDDKKACLLSELVLAMELLIDEHGDIPVLLSSWDYTVIVPILKTLVLSENADGTGNKVAVIAFDRNEMVFNTSEQAS